MLTVDKINALRISKDYSNCNIVKRAGDISKRYPNSAQLNSAYDEYCQLLIAYKSKYNYEYSCCFDLPFAWFYLFGGKVFLRGIKQDLSCKNIFEFLKSINMPFDINDENILKIVPLLRTLLKYSKNQGYFSYIDNYKTKYGVSSAYILDAPMDNFLLFDNNLCFRESSTGTIYKVNESFARTLFLNNGLNVPSTSEFRGIFSSMTKLLLENSIAQPAYSNPYIISYSLSKTTNINVEYDHNTKLFKINYNYEDPNTLKKIISLPKIQPTTYIPTRFAKFLLLLSQGDLSVVDNFSKLIATTLVSRNLSKNICVLYVPKCSQIVRDLLTQIFSHKIITDSFKSLCDTKSINKLISNKLDGVIACIPEKHHLPTGENIKILQSIYKSKPIKAKDYFSGRKTFVNNLRLIYITENDNEVNILKNTYDTQVIYFSCPSDIDLYLCNTELNAEELSWIRTSFALHGLKLIANSSNNETKYPVSSNCILHNFLTACCLSEDDSTVYAEDLYFAYESYVKMKYGGNPMSRKQMVNAIKALGKYRYFRPHYNSNNNRYAFKGIILNKDALRQILLDYNYDIYVEQSDYYNHLKSMNGLYP